jgi:ketose-bisphosphate aldolase
MDRSNLDFERVLLESTLDEVMRGAFNTRILVPAFNVAYLPMVEPIVATLRELECFGLLEVALPDLEKFGAQSLSAVKREYTKYGERAFSRLHLDHVPVVNEDGDRVNWNAMMREALSLGFDSVMIDGSRLSLEENIDVTRKVVEMAHAKQVPVEAELGAVYGHEKGPLPPYEELFRSGRGFTDPGEAKRFVEETGVDWLSVAIGNIHGAISGAAKDEKKLNARLNVDHLRKIVSATNVPIVLHGGSGIERESVLSGIRNGVTKINIGTAIRQVFEKEMRKTGNVEAAQTQLRQEIQEMIEDYYGILGNTRKLASLLKKF